MFFDSIKTSKKLTRFLKGLAISAVVLVHALNFFNRQIYLKKPGIIFFALNQALRFSVPFFIFLSGFGLTLKYKEEDFYALKFLSHQLKKILPLYFLWTLYLGLMGKFFAFKEPVFAEQGILKTFLFGKADYHLYFVPLIVQMYFLFTLFQVFWDRVTKFWATVFLLVQLGIYLFFSITFNMPSDQLQYSIFISWIGYFVLGILLAQKKKFFNSKINLLMVVGGFLTSLIYAYFTSKKTENVVQANRFTKVPVFIYSVGLIGLFLQNKLTALREKKLFSWLGCHSYLIFLAHTLPIHLFQEPFQVSVYFPVLASYLLIIFLSVQLAKAINH